LLDAKTTKGIWTKIMLGKKMGSSRGMRTRSEAIYSKIEGQRGFLTCPHGTKIISEPKQSVNCYQ